MVTQPFVVRPAPGPYPAQANLPNINKYSNAAAQGIAISSSDVDADINNCIDAINSLYANVQNATAGVIPGANSPGNQFRFPVTDGNSNISWVQVNSAYVAVNGLPVAKLDQHTQGSMITWDQNQQPLVIAPGNPGDILQMIGVMGNTYPSFVAGGFLPLTGGTLAPNAFFGLPTAFSASIGTADGFLNGTGNGASYSLYNVQMKMTAGLGFTNTASDAAVGYLDFTVGKLSMSAGYWMKNSGGVDTEGAVLPATDTEMQAAIANNRAVTPANIQDSPFVAQGSALISIAGSGSIISSNGGSWSVTSNNAGPIAGTVTMPWTFTSVDNYIVQISVSSTTTAFPNVITVHAKTTNTFNFSIYGIGGGSATNVTSVMVTVFAFTNP